MNEYKLLLIYILRTEYYRDIYHPMNIMNNNYIPYYLSLFLYVDRVRPPLPQVLSEVSQLRLI